MPSITNAIKTTKASKGSPYFLQSLVLTLLIMATFLLSHNAYALSQVTAVIDKNPAMINESILLTVTADDDVSRNALDTSPLLKDFIVGQTSVSSQTSSVNFKTSRMTKWQVILIARNTGELVIPALTIENQQSKPLKLTVVDTKSNPNKNTQTDIFITSELSNNEVYVQQSLTLTIKLHFAVELQSASITEPNFTGAIIEKVAKDEQSDTIVNGKRYRVIEQTYGITPEKSGEFTLEAPVFSGEIRQASSRRSSFMNFGQSKPVSIVGNELKLNVLPIPPNYPSNAEWLPTDILILHEEWQGGDGQFTVGEPITRTVTLTAAGLSKAQLPKVDMKSSQGLKIYPDQAELNSALREGRLISQKVQNFALVPSHAGEFVLPAMEVTWFNIITNKTEKATLPSQTISVKASEDGLLTNATNGMDKFNNSTTSNNAVSGANETTCTDELASQNTPTTTLVSVEDKRLQWLFLSLWILTSLAWFAHVIYLKQGNHKNKKTQPKNVNIIGNHYLALLAACKKNNAEQALNLILPWLKQLLDDDKSGLEISNIAQGQAIVNEESFVTALNDLQQHLYGKGANDDSTSWTGIELSNAIQKVNNQEKTPSDQLSSLNP